MLSDYEGSIEGYQYLIHDTCFSHKLLHKVWVMSPEGYIACGEGSNFDDAFCKGVELTKNNWTLNSK